MKRIQSTIRLVAIVLPATLGVLGGLWTIACFIFPVARQITILLPFGWAAYLWRNLSQLTINREIAIDFFLAMVLATAGLHAAFYWAIRRLNSGGAWPFRQTAKITALVLLLFAACVTATGLVRNVTWLLDGQELVTNRNREQALAHGVFYALEMFASDHAGEFPQTLDQLFPDYLSSRHPLFVDSTSPSPPEPLLYFSGHQASDGADRVILASPRPRGGRRFIMQINGTGEMLTELEFQGRLAEEHVSEEDL